MLEAGPFFCTQKLILVLEGCHPSTVGGTSRGLPARTGTKQRLIIKLFGLELGWGRAVRCWCRWRGNLWWW